MKCLKDKTKNLLFRKCEGEATLFKTCNIQVITSSKDSTNKYTEITKILLAIFRIVLIKMLTFGLNNALRITP